MKVHHYLIFSSLIAIALLSWAFLPKSTSPMNESLPQMQIAHMGKGDTKGFEAIRQSFQQHNPGFDMAFLSETFTIPGENTYRVAFLQTGGGTATLSNGESSKVSVGDIIMLKEGIALEADSALSFLVFTSPKAPSKDIPTFVRPDWDMNITDTPGGCATETNAYRRILLTWRSKVGTYLYHAINAHRVRIMNSFTHYHPKEGGFDEFYLVQMAMDDAKIITSNRVDLITNPEKVTKKDAQNLLQTTPLEVGDVVYLPRGVIHRGLDGVLAQVITVPGFIPGSEIGVDHHLRKINELLGLEGDEALPYNEEASTKVIVK